MTIENAVVQIIGDLPDGHLFSGLWLTDRVRELRDDMTLDGSCTKLLRVAKRSIPPKLNYEVVDRGKSLYKKLPVHSEPKFQTESNGQLCMI